jgi:hypothetical protein
VQTKWRAKVLVRNLTLGRLLALPEQLRQPRDVRRDAACLIFCEHVRLPRLGLGLAAIDVGERSCTGVTDAIAARYRVGVPGRREAAGWVGHGVEVVPQSQNIR